MKVGMRMTLAALVASGLIAAGCGGDDPDESGAGSPEDTVNSYIAAGQDGDGERVCELLTDDSVDLLEQFGGGECADIAAEDVSDLPDDFEIGDVQEDGDSATVQVTGDGDEISIPLTKEGDDWKIDLGAIEVPDTSVPEDLTVPGS